MTPTPPRAALLRRFATCASGRTAVAAAVVGFAAYGAGIGGVIDLGAAAALMVAGHAAVATVAGIAAYKASRAASGVSRSVWTLFLIGLGLWIGGCASYVAFLVTGGTLRNPAAWTQIGFVMAYLPWYRALWLMRQPVLGRSRFQRWESTVIEVIALGLLATVLGAALWTSEHLTAGQNLTLLLPGVLDLLLVAGLYNAVRRSRLTLASAHAWLALAFLCLGATDILVTILVPHGYFELAGLALTGYAIALGFVGAAAGRPLRLAETRYGVSRSSAALALLALALIAPATALLPPEGRVATWIIGGALLAWLWTYLSREGRSDLGVLTGMVGQDALRRHLSGALALARNDRPAGLVMMKVDGLAEWTEEHGFHAADKLVQEIAGALEDVELAEGGAWAHLSSDRFAWLGVINDADSGRRAAYRMANAVSEASDSALSAWCGVTLLPADADTAEDAITAAHEAAAVAKAARRRVVLFERGELEGLQSDASFGTNLRARKAKILEIMRCPESLLAVFQPIVDLDRQGVRGFEALSRFMCEPRQGPDVWIAEAHSLGLGIEMEAECIRRALVERHKAPPGSYISLNVSPDLLMSSQLDDVLEGHSLEGIVLELTEHHHVADYALIADRLALLRGKGARMAVDDVGAGHSSMRHVMNLRPDVIKVDRWMVTDINNDSGKRALMRSFVALSSELSASLVVEGVETVEELSVLHELGVRIAQGYLFARPDREFTEAVAWDTLRLAASTPTLEAEALPAFG